MEQIRARVAQRRAEGVYRHDLDAVGDQVFGEVMSQPEAQPEPLPEPAPSPALAPDLALAPASPSIHPLKELRARWKVQEPTFVAKLPVVGGAIVHIRRAWYSMFTKRSVRAIVRQVHEFHRLVVGAFKHYDAEHRKLAEQVSRVEQALAQSNETLARSVEALAQSQAHEVANLRMDVARLRIQLSRPPRGKS